MDKINYLKNKNLELKLRLTLVQEIECSKRKPLNG